MSVVADSVGLIEVIVRIRTGLCTGAHGKASPKFPAISILAAR